MHILTVFSEHTLGIEKYLRDDEYPSGLIFSCRKDKLNHEEIVRRLLESPIFYYRFANAERELWNITKTPFCDFKVHIAWEGFTPFPAKEEIESWLKTL